MIKHSCLRVTFSGLQQASIIHFFINYVVLTVHLNAWKCDVDLRVKSYIRIINIRSMAELWCCIALHLTGGHNKVATQGMLLLMLSSSSLRTASCSEGITCFAQQVNYYIIYVTQMSYLKGL